MGVGVEGGGHDYRECYVIEVSRSSYSILPSTHQPKQPKNENQQNNLDKINKASIKHHHRVE